MVLSLCSFSKNLLRMFLDQKSEVVLNVQFIRWVNLFRRSVELSSFIEAQQDFYTDLAPLFNTVVTLYPCFLVVRFKRALGVCWRVTCVVMWAFKLPPIYSTIANKALTLFLCLFG